MHVRLNQQLLKHPCVCVCLVLSCRVCVQGGSFANFICNVRRHRPDGKRTIDWE